MHTIQNFAEACAAARRASTDHFEDMLKKARAVDPTACFDNTIHDEWAIRCAPDKETEVRAALGWAAE